MCGKERESISPAFIHVCDFSLPPQKKKYREVVSLSSTLLSQKKKSIYLNSSPALCLQAVNLFVLSSLSLFLYPTAVLLSPVLYGEAVLPFSPGCVCLALWRREGTGGFSFSELWAILRPLQLCPSLAVVEGASPSPQVGAVFWNGDRFCIPNSQPFPPDIISPLLSCRHFSPSGFSSHPRFLSPPGIVLLKKKMALFEGPGVHGLRSLSAGQTSSASFFFILGWSRVSIVRLPLAESLARRLFKKAWAGGNLRKNSAVRGGP